MSELKTPQEENALWTKNDLWPQVDTGGGLLTDRTYFEITTTGADLIGISYADAVNLIIDWGDSTSTTCNGSSTANHTYADAGVYTLTMKGQCSNFRFLTNPTKLTKILSPIQGLNVTGSFFQTFYGCTNLTGPIPTDLFRYNINVSTNGFNQTFRGCSNLTGSIPTDLFRYNTLVSTSGFNATFYGCTNLTTAPSGLFKYNTSCTSFYLTFYGCIKLVIPSDLFYDQVDRDTRFFGQTVDFREFFSITSWSGASAGTAPDLWNAAGTFTDTTGAFASHDATSLSNWASIPTAWGGPL